MSATPGPAADVFRRQILERRTRLEAAAEALPAEYLNRLLDEVDAALERIDDGSYGICETCHDSIEADRLRANPMVRFCLDHLSRQELRAHEQDLELATRIQSRLLPPGDLAVGHWEAHYLYESAGPVGGDYCELASLEDRRSLFFALGDVAGKGVAASLLMTHLSAIVRSLLSLRLPLPEMIARANRLFCESTLAAHYATLVCGRATEAGVEFCNAGHCPPLAVRPGGVQRFETAGLPLGLFCDAEYPVVRCGLAEGESLVLYSDGVTEAQDPHGNEFGEEGLSQSLQHHFGHPTHTVAHAVAQDVALFRRGGRPADDLTILTVCRQSRPAQNS